MQRPPPLSPRWSFSSRTRKEGVRTPAPLPLLFSSASSQSAPSSGTSRGEGGGGRWPRGRRLQARGERDPRLQPRPAMRGSPSPHCPQRLGGRGLQSRARPRPTRGAAGSLAGRPCGPRPILGGAHSPLHRDRAGSGGGGPAYRDVRDALLALVRHGPPPHLWRPRPGRGTLWGWLSLGAAVSRSRFPRARRQRPRPRDERHGARLPVAARPARPPPQLRLPAPPGSARRAGRGREEGAADRQLLPAARSRARFAPLASNQEALPFRSPLSPHSAPRPPTNQPRRPPPRAHALGWAPASLSRLGRSGFFRALLKARDGLRMRRRRPWAAPQVCGPSWGPGRGAPGTSVWGTECGPDAQNPPPLPRLLECFEDTVQQPPAFDLSFHSLRLSAAPLAAQLKHISSPKSKPLFKLCPLSEYLTSSTRLISNGFSMNLFSATPPTPITEPVCPGTQ